MVNITPNANFYSLNHAAADPDRGGEYRRYRRAWMELPQAFIVRDFPLHLDIEITSRCNLRCTYCDKLPVLPRSKIGDMDIQLFKRIIDEGARHNLWGVKLSYRGEPLLHPQIFEMIAYAKEKGVLDIYFNTNGTLLSRPVAKELIASGLDRISVSVDGIDPEFFNRERVGADFAKVTDNIAYLMQARNEALVLYPRVRVQTVRLPNFDLAAYREFWAKRVDEVAAIDFKEGKTRKKGIIYAWGCPQLWQRMTIEWDGTIHPCNNDDDDLFTLGNVREKSVREYWHDLRVSHIRELHQCGQSHMVKACDGCPWRTAQIEKLAAPGPG